MSSEHDLNALLGVSQETLAEKQQERERARQFELDLLFNHGQELYGILTQTEYHRNKMYHELLGRILAGFTHEDKVLRRLTPLNLYDHLRYEGILDFASKTAPGPDMPSDTADAVDAIANRRMVLQGTAVAAYGDQQIALGTHITFLATNGDLKKAPRIVEAIKQFPEETRAGISLDLKRYALPQTRT